MKKITYCVALLVLASFVDVRAQSCTDSDQGVSPTAAGSVTITTASGIKTTYTDKCSLTGLKVTEYACSGTALTSSTLSCANGCTDGACVTELSPEGCFLKLVIEEREATEYSEDSLFSLKQLTPVIGNFFNTSLRITDSSDVQDLNKIILYSSSNAILATYGIPPQRPIVTEVISSTISDGYLSYRPKVSFTMYVQLFDTLSRIEVLQYNGTRTQWTVAPASLSCARPCIQATQVGITSKSDQCCSGTVKKLFNTDGFVCNAIPSASASPTPAAL
jgi:hypothetical protein